MNLADTAEANETFAGAGRAPLGAIASRALPLLAASAGSILISWVVLAAIAALSPAVGWMGKQMIDGLEGAGGGLLDILLINGWQFGLLFTALKLLEVLDKPVGKWVESRLVIGLQDSYLARRREACPTDDAAQMLYGADEAKKGLKIVIDDVPKLVFTLASVGLWQMALAPEWLPFMTLAIVPSLLWLWLLIGPVQASAERALAAQIAIAGATDGAARSGLSQAQRRWLVASVIIDAFKGLGEKGLVWLIWAAFVGSVLAFLLAFPDTTLGRDMSPGEFVVTMVNLSLLVDPLSRLGKIAMHMAQARPALECALGLARNPNHF
ncbi:hypothetical protein EDC22_102158 [Tepidamorphus gemmatus]|uniref:ABC transporter transmembrane protein n=1 Tax=Tepidamorphus gemmatus TaxID=747076 RepID=A0A4V2UZT3_9HYPH|nr:hypothetical protein [Tepidamorphus gemmatus]TCT12473.1 hypothetical protein EDC22_102158 [Tepidamorphus gemmatus]